MYNRPMDSSNLLFLQFSLNPFLNYTLMKCLDNVVTVPFDADVHFTFSCLWRAAVAWQRQPYQHNTPIQLVSKPLVCGSLNCHSTVS